MRTRTCLFRWLSSSLLASLIIIPLSWVALPQSRTLDPVAIVVTAFDDGFVQDGKCSLREAVQAANIDQAVDACTAGSGADTISLAAGTYRLTRAGANEDQNQTGDLDILADLKLQGAGAARTIVDGGMLDRVLHIGPGAEVALNDLTVTNGAAPAAATGQAGNPGGGVLNEGDLALRHCKVSRNVAGAGSRDGGHDGGHGGGIFNQGSAIVAFCEISENTAGAGTDVGTGDGGRGGRGGGIFNAGVLTLTLSSVLTNTAGAGGKSQNVMDFGGIGGAGGGIANAGSLVVEQSRIGANRSGRSATRPGAEGGGIYNSGTITLLASTVDHNETVPGSTEISPPGIDGGSGGPGAGIFNAGTLLAQNCTISGNRTADGQLPGGGTHSYGGDGGDGAGIFNELRLVLDDCTVTENVTGAGAPAGPGGILPEGGRAGNGGGIFNAGTTTATVELRNVILAGNKTAGQGPECMGVVNSRNFNLILTIAGCARQGELDKNIVGQDPLLLPLGDYGGTTATHGLGVGSPAIDAGSCINSLGQVVGTDQRSQVRPQLVTCDIGAYEANYIVGFLPSIGR